MTNSQSSLSVLKKQADHVAAVLKAVERGDNLDDAFAATLTVARAKPIITFAVAMDDKVLKIQMTWETIRATSEVGIAAYILRQMRGARETTQ